MTKPKKISQEDITGARGVALIERIVLQMGFLWTPTNLEAGIDGYIEIRDSATGEVSNCILQVQSKAGSSWFKAEDEKSFEFVCDERDLQYWLGGNAPVILVVSRPDNDEAYWVSIKDYFRDPKTWKDRRIKFDKQTGCFDQNCKLQLANLAIPADSGLYLSAIPRKETLATNLLPVEYPRRIFLASTRFRSRASLAERLCKLTRKPQYDWLLDERFLYSFHDLTFEPWSKVCISSTVENLSTDDWAKSTDIARRRLFVQLMNRCVSELFYRQRVRYSPDKDRYYFQATHDLSPKKIGKLTVFKGYESKTVEGRIAYYRHWAICPQFLYFGMKWYLEVTPTYHFTQDGRKLSAHYAQRMRGIKILERQNKGHLSQVKLWEKVLRQLLIARAKPKAHQRSLFGDDVDEDGEPPEPYTLISFGPLAAFDVNFGITDDAWLPVSDDEQFDPDQRGLFET